VVADGSGSGLLLTKVGGKPSGRGIARASASSLRFQPGACPPIDAPGMLPPSPGQTTRNRRNFIHNRSTSFVRNAGRTIRRNSPRPRTETIPRKCYPVRACLLH
jgi:hypothetical protein